MTMPKMLLQRYNWHTSSCHKLIFSGRVFYQQLELDADRLVQFLLNENEDISTDLVCDLSGFFSIVVQTNDAILLVSDRVRSIPIFYQISESRLSISDDCFLLDCTDPADEIVAREFTALGYVTGNDTLFGRTKQVPAGSIVRISGSCVKQQRYFIFRRVNETSSENDNRMLQELHSVMTSVINECTRVAGGRQIVVPLSGGYDSRALLLFLKKTGYDNILTFTFGAASSPELVLAGKLAQELKVRWFPVVYTARLWRDLRHDVEFADYLQFISNGVSVPNIQMWPALKILVRQGVIEKDALFLPGHTGDFVSGGHLSGETARADELSLPEIALSIYQKHYQLDRVPPNHELLQRILLGCKDLIGDMPNCTVEDLKDAWNWQERQSKFIVNSNRYYEFFQLEWWLPFWQREFVYFWLQVPKTMLRKQQLWQRFVDEECRHAGVSAITGNAANISVLPQVLNLGLNYFFDRNLLLWFMPFRCWLLYRLHLSKHSGTLNSYLTRMILRCNSVFSKNAEN